MYTNQLSRRTILGGAVSGFFAMAMRHRCHAAFAGQPTGKAKRCVLLWMNGGPSQIDTFDPKPGTKSGGEFAAIDTAVSGLQISETLPQIAREMSDLSVIRNLTSPEGDHGRAEYYLHTGFKFVPAFPRPAFGSVVSHETPAANFPRYVSIGSSSFGPAYLGNDHAPFSIQDPTTALKLLQRIQSRKKRIGLLQELGETFDRDHREDVVQQRTAMISKIESMVDTQFVKALDLSLETEKNRARYGESKFGKSCLAARRLLEAGVNFVEVQQNGWDTHANNFPQVRNLCGIIDQPWATLMQDLLAGGLLDETIVLWMGEFGRTPSINANRGRDHYPQVTSAVIGGGGLRGGEVIGKTNRIGTQIDGDAYQVPDLMATIFTAMGIDPQQEFTTDFDSPTTATDDGVVIRELT